MTTTQERTQIAAVIGGAVAGSQMVHSLTSQGIRCVVFDQNILPHGKIEDGLPKWHSKQRDSEEAAINERLSHPLVHYVPLCKLGESLTFEELLKWNFTAVVLATGAWKDRPLPVEGIDEYINNGLYYQNPFVYWYNHKHEPGYSGPRYQIADDAIVIGGGLASIDVVKILMMELVSEKLKQRGIETNLFEMNHGINKVLAKNNISFSHLGLKGCTLFYRRRNMDMPLTEAQATTPAQLLKTQAARQKILDNFMSKYFFRFKPCMAPAGKVVENGKLTGVIFRKTDADENKCVEIAGSETVVKAPLVISSIGSVPEHITGATGNGVAFKIADDTSSRLAGFDNVFVIGNAVTGKGNIADSVQHAKQIAAWMHENFFPQVATKSEADLQLIIAKTKQLQQKQGYHGNFSDWVQQHTPVRIENMTGATASAGH